MHQNKALVSLCCDITLIATVVFCHPTSALGPDLTINNGNNDNHHGSDQLLSRRGLEDANMYSNAVPLLDLTPTKTHPYSMEPFRERNNLRSHQGKGESMHAKEGKLWNSHWDAAGDQLRLAKGAFNPNQPISVSGRLFSATNAIGLGAKALAASTFTATIKAKNRVMQAGGAIPYHGRDALNRVTARKNAFHGFLQNMNDPQPTLDSAREKIQAKGLHRTRAV